MIPGLGNDAGSIPVRTTINMYMIEFGLVYFVLVIESMGKEITDRVYYSKLSDCTHIARELNFTYTGAPPIRAYCIPETMKADK